MSSQFFGLNIAYTGLLASNAALNTTSNNISNVQTAGYSRQQVIQQAADAIRVFQTYGCAGAGVETLAIERIRNEFYDTKYWNSNTQLGEYSIKQNYMSQLEDFFADDGTKTGFKTVFDQLMATGLQALLNNPSDPAAKKQFIGYAEELTEYFNGMSSSLKNTQKDLNQELKLRVDQMNALSGEIAALNKQINVIEMSGSGATANELRDRRTLLIDQLSEIVDVETSETPIMDTNNARETGGNNFVVKIAGGQILVDGNDYNQLECVARTSSQKVNQTDIDGLYDVYWGDGQSFNLYDTSMGGALRGIVEMRDGNNNENFTGTITSIGKTTGTDNVERDTVTVKVTKEYLKDLNKCNLSDQGGKITLGNQVFYYDSWSYSCTYPYKTDADGNVVNDADGNPVYDETAEPTYSYTFTLSDSQLNDRRVTNDRVGKPATTGKDIAYQGIPYYMNQMNEWVRTFAQKFNDILKSGYTSDNKEGEVLFAAKKAVNGEQYDFTEDYRYDHQTTGSMTVGMKDDSYYKLTAENFSILEAMLSKSELLATKKSTADGAEQNDLLTDLKNMSTDKSKMSYRGCSAGEFLQCIMGDVALNAGNANTFYENYKNITYSVDNQRISISGVDEDEEAVNLIKYQNGYNLASKMIQTLTEVYDRLILQTGV